MIFSELYGAYYNTVANILKEAIKKPLSKNEIRDIIKEKAFLESNLNIEPMILSERWNLVSLDGSTPIINCPSMPLTTLEKRWLKAIYMDPRIKLFTDEEDIFSDVKPLFTLDDIMIFDKYSDGDNYLDIEYQKKFRLVLDAIEKEYPLEIDMVNRKGNITSMVMLPMYLEYSEKDDKFRVIGKSNRYGGTINLARILKCTPYSKPFKEGRKKNLNEKRKIEFELVDNRNALERVLLHFAHFEKEVIKIDDTRYKVCVIYDKEDETEMVIRILSFGPMIKVISPNGFIELIKERLIKQKSCE